jgi:hypothetical protein
MKIELLDSAGVMNLAAKGEKPPKELTLLGEHVEETLQGKSLSRIKGLIEFVRKVESVHTPQQTSPLGYVCDLHKVEVETATPHTDLEPVPKEVMFKTVSGETIADMLENSPLQALQDATNRKREELHHLEYLRLPDEMHGEWIDIDKYRPKLVRRPSSVFGMKVWEGIDLITKLSIFDPIAEDLLRKERIKREHLPTLAEAVQNHYELAQKKIEMEEGGSIRQKLLKEGLPAEGLPREIQDFVLQQFTFFWRMIIKLHPAADRKLTRRNLPSLHILWTLLDNPVPGIKISPGDHRDKRMASLLPYVDVLHVDGRTLEKLRQAKDPFITSLLGKTKRNR